MQKVCEGRDCKKIAVVYGGGPYAGDWAGFYCLECLPDGFAVWDRISTSRND